MSIKDFETKPKPEGKKREEGLGPILADEKQSALFGAYVKSAQGKPGEAPEAGKERAERLLKGESTEEDREVLGKQKEGFLERQKEVKRISEALKPKFIEEIAVLSPKLQELVRFGGVEGVHKTITSQLEMLAMRDPSRFKNMVRSYDQLIAKTEAADERLKEICKESNVTEEKYKEIIASTPDESERNEKLKELIRESMYKVKWYHRNKEERRNDQEDEIKRVSDLNSIDELSILRKTYEADLKNVGEVLAFTINKDAAMSKAINAFASGQEMAQEELGGFGEMQGVMQQDEDSFKKEGKAQWEAFETANPGSDIDTFKASYSDKKVGNKTGTWSDIAKGFIMKAVEKW